MFKPDLSAFEEGEDISSSSDFDENDLQNIDALIAGMYQFYDQVPTTHVEFEFYLIIIAASLAMLCYHSTCAPLVY